MAGRRSRSGVYRKGRVYGSSCTADLARAETGGTKSVKPSGHLGHPYRGIQCFEVLCGQPLLHDSRYKSHSPYERNVFSDGPARDRDCFSEKSGANGEA